MQKYDAYNKVYAKNYNSVLIFILLSKTCSFTKITGKLISLKLVHHSLAIGCIVMNIHMKFLYQMH